jgi:hypothetical protein
MIAYMEKENRRNQAAEPSADREKSALERRGDD